MTNSKEIKPEELKDYNDINESDIADNQLGLTGGHPERYGWYKRDEKFYAHRKPTVKEVLNNTFS